MKIITLIQDLDAALEEIRTQARAAAAELERVTALAKLQEEEHERVKRQQAEQELAAKVCFMTLQITIISFEFGQKQKEAEQAEFNRRFGIRRISVK